MEDKYGSVINKLFLKLNNSNIEITTVRNPIKFELYTIKVFKNGIEIKSKREDVSGVEKTNKRIFALKKEFKKIDE
jgi:hypothetical protein